MADDEDAYIDDDEDFEWFYVEDTCPLADELAESALPEPGYPGTAAELDALWDDLDLFHYWDDLEYGHDPYWDTAALNVSGEKRKRDGRVPRSSGKRRKLSLKETSGDKVMFVSTEERRRLWSRRPPIRKGLKSFALLPDWRKRCAAADKEMSVRAMPAEMRQAAEANEEEGDDDPPQHERLDNHGAQEEGDEWEDDEDDAPDAGQLDIDPDALKAVLRERLGDAGVGGLSEEACMAAIQKLLQGGEDAADDLTNALLADIGQTGGNEALEGWLTRQGVTLEEDEDADNHAESVAAQETSNTAGRKEASQRSPSDSVIGARRASGKTRQAQQSDGSPETGKKRSAPVAEGREGRMEKRAKAGDLGQDGEVMPEESKAEVPDTSTRTTRKRKAREDDEAEEEESSKPATKKRPGRPAKAVTSRTSDEQGSKPSYARETRATRARSKR